VLEKSTIGISVKNRSWPVAVATLVCLVPTACSHRRVTPQAASGDVANPSLALAQGTVTIAHSGTAELALHVQIADTDTSRATGLMGVKKMSDRAGMAFVFDGPSAESFWMKDTLIPLDIAFWDAQGHITTLFSMVPCTADPCHLYTSSAPYVGSVEMNAGLLAAHGVNVGDTVTLSR